MPPEKISITRVKKYYLFLHSSTENGDKQKKNIGRRLKRGKKRTGKSYLKPADATASADNLKQRYQRHTIL